MGHFQRYLSGMSLTVLTLASAWAEDKSNIIRFESSDPIPAPSILSAPPSPSLTFPIPAPEDNRFVAPDYLEKQPSKGSWLSLDEAPAPAAPNKPAFSRPAPPPPQAVPGAVPFRPAPQMLPRQVQPQQPPAAGFDYEIFRKSIEAELEQAARNPRPAPPSPTAAPASAAQAEVKTEAKPALSADLAKQLHELVNLQTAMQSNLQESQRQLQQANERYQALLSEKNNQTLEFQKKVSDLEAEITRLKNDNSTQAKELGELQATVEKLQTQLKAQESSKGQLEAKLSDAEKLQTSLEQATRERDALFAKLQQALKHENEAGQKLAALQKQLDSTRQELEAARAEAGKVTQLEQKLQALDAENSKLHRELASAQQFQNSQKSELSDALAQLAKSSTVIAGLQSALAEADKKPDLSGELAALKTRLEETEKAQASLEQTLIATQKERDELQATLQEKTTQCNTLQGELETRKAEAADCALQVDNLKAQLQEMETSNEQLLLKTRDSDADGVNDFTDQCPDSPQGQTVDAQGCMLDSDGDKIADDKDLCPNSRGEVDALGCDPEAPITLEGLQFKTGSARFDEASLKVLQRLADTLKAFPELKLEIAGHTDNIGEREKNIYLSNRRAKAVKNKLVELGINADRLTSRGYGPDEPVADNTTAEGRASNRRVELRRQ